ncbi:hypothetical protein M8818_004726 [Zalaria obscura]|uniref:Uncharacterized protein n=1 Tax=Zalaria obscura TaxID=2024903 RepID=A0ACC3SF12_9PEZI
MSATVKKPATAGGAGIGGTPVSARAAVKKPASGTTSRSGTPDPTSAAEEDAKAEMAATLETLREQLRAAEKASDDYQKQVKMMQVKLDDAVKEQGRLEENVHEHMERLEEIENEKKDSNKSRRELEAIYESERAAAMKEKEEAQGREEELMDTVRRLKESIAQRDLRGTPDGDGRPSLSRVSSYRNSISPNPDSGHFAPPSSLQRSDSRSSSRLVMQKDKIIEGLRLELAESQIKLVEMENMGGGRMQELEKALMEARMANARLMEDNESFQLLLSEKTLNGDFAQSEFLRAPSPNSRPTSRERTPGGTTLADELSSDDNEEDQSPSTSTRKPGHAEINALKDQNKALTLYINNIISRLLQHSEFENILDKTPNIMAGPTAASARYAGMDIDKDLPPPPPPQSDKDAPQPPSLLQRARSVVGARARPRPTSQSPVPEQSVPGVTEDPSTAPRVPLGRTQSVRTVSGGHRRSATDWAPAAVVNNMYRGPSPASGQISPGLGSPRPTSFYGAGAGFVSAAAAARVPSGTGVPAIAEAEMGARDKENMAPSAQRNSAGSGSGNLSGRNSVVSEGGDGMAMGMGAASPPRSTGSSGDRPLGQAVMVGSKMRPLRLVQEAAELEEAGKKANRGSWMGWFNKGGKEAVARAE